MRVSVIIPFYNAEKHIAETINSILNQSYKDIEIICVDNNSDDNSVNVVRDFLDREMTIKLFSESRRGASYAREKGLNEATGQVIQFLDADDIIQPKKIQTQIEHLIAGDYDMVVSDRSVWNADFTKRIDFVEFSNINDSPLQVAIAKVISSGNAIYKKEIVDKVGGYTPHLTSCQDWDFHIKIIQAEAKIGYLKGDFFFSRTLEDSLSSNWIKVSYDVSVLIFQYKKFFLDEKVFLENASFKKIIHVYLQCLLRVDDREKSKFLYQELLFWSRKSKGIKQHLSKSDYFIYTLAGFNGLIKMKRFINLIVFRRSKL